MLSRFRSDSINPYIALADVYMNLGVAFIIFAMLFMLLGHRGWEDVRYREEQRRFAASVLASPALANKVKLSNRNDAPGEQRWMLPSATLFAGGSSRLTPKGQKVLGRFAHLLGQNQRLWWRIRVEAHARQRAHRAVASEERAAFALTAMRAVEVALYLHSARLAPYRIVASGRGHQDLYVREHPASAANDRVDILLIPRSVHNNAGSGTR